MNFAGAAKTMMVCTIWPVWKEQSWGTHASPTQPSVGLEPSCSTYIWPSKVPIPEETERPSPDKLPAKILSPVGAQQKAFSISNVVSEHVKMQNAMDAIRRVNHVYVDSLACYIHVHFLSACPTKGPGVIDTIDTTHSNAESGCIVSDTIMEIWQLTG